MTMEESLLDVVEQEATKQNRTISNFIETTVAKALGVEVPA